jgi:hypothetical protein
MVKIWAKNMNNDIISEEKSFAILQISQEAMQLNK